MGGPAGRKGRASDRAGWRQCHAGGRAATLACSPRRRHLGGLVLQSRSRPMPASLVFKSADFESVYGWLEGQADLMVEVWGMENERRAALLAYNDDPQDGFSWSNWAAAAREDPSELAGLF